MLKDPESEQSKRKNFIGSVTIYKIVEMQSGKDSNFQLVEYISYYVLYIGHDYTAPLNTIKP